MKKQIEGRIAVLASVEKAIYSQRSNIEPEYLEELKQDLATILELHNTQLTLRLGAEQQKEYILKLKKEKDEK